MAKIKKVIIGFITMLIAASAIFIILDNKVGLNVLKDKTEIFVNLTGQFELGGTEYNFIKNPKNTLTKLSYLKVTRSITDDGMIKIVRSGRNTKTKINVTDTYLFDPKIDDVTKFPLDHNVMILNAKGYTYEYVVKDLTYYGGDLEFTGQTSYSFGKQIKVTWQEGYEYAGITGNTLTVKYLIDSDNYSVNVRMFDPPVYNYCYQESSNVSNQVYTDGVCGVLNYTSNIHWA